jgi:hypothetical protein
VNVSHCLPQEPEKPKANPETTSCIIRIVSDTLSAKESGGRALMIRASRVAKIRYKKKEPGYKLLDSGNAFIKADVIFFIDKFTGPFRKANEDSLQAAAKELKEEHNRELRKKIEK